MSEDRNRAEAEFFDHVYGENAGAGLNGFYDLSAGRSFFASLLLGAAAPGVRMLEYGCGPGGYAFDLAARGADVTGIDIAPVAIQQATEQAAAHPSAFLRFRLGDATALDFDDSSFDVVCGTSILHHLDVDKAAAEVRRVLRPGGRAMFYEPVGHNPLVNLYRRLTPKLHTEDEHPLVSSDFAILRRLFPRLKLHFFDFFSVGAIPFLRLPGGKALLRMAEAIDRVVLRLPPVWKMASVVVIEIER